jgi:predicted metal-dependent phosphotriesterase family hydrolase
MVGCVSKPEQVSKETPGLRSSITSGRDEKAEPKVVTVTGDISPEELDVCDAHTHVWIDAVECAAEDAPVLNNREEILTDLVEFKEAGGDALTDCQPGGCGRNGNRLIDLAQASGVIIIACTGFHRTRYYPNDYWIWKAEAGKITDYFIIGSLISPDYPVF